MSPLRSLVAVLLVHLDVVDATAVLFGGATLILGPGIAPAAVASSMAGGATTASTVSTAAASTMAATSLTASGTASVGAAAATAGSAAAATAGTAGAAAAGGGAGSGLTAAALASLPAGPAGPLFLAAGLVGAEGSEENITWDCWKPVVRDNSTQLSGGMELSKLLRDDRIKKYEVHDDSVYVLNAWDELFQLWPVLLPRQNLFAWHATSAV